MTTEDLRCHPSDCSGKVSLKPIDVQPPISNKTISAVTHFGAILTSIIYRSQQ